MTAEKKTAGKKGLPGRITRGLLSILVPLQETKWIVRSAQHMTTRNLERMRDAFPERKNDDVLPASPDWEKAVADSGCTQEELDKGYVIQRRRWRALFWLMAIPVPLAALMPLFTGASISAHQISTCAVLFSGAGVAWSKALIVSYRLWQLRSRRVSLAEGGTFRHFMTETHAVRDAIRGK
ncbi:conjugal transfer protein TraX [Lelliottia amnigena]|uniref:conjugal transfer protein TraX n=1 Tax=Lelliottia amnigena TaxID=61646 RepID=UPI001C225204|nr:conjugal transfer protein TraX [Lelliottia amnigena]QXB24140.1 conjugal transfer protein TraX [Lelliottia amnigena]